MFASQERLSSGSPMSLKPGARLLSAVRGVHAEWLGAYRGIVQTPMPFCSAAAGDRSARHRECRCGPLILPLVADAATRDAMFDGIRKRSQKLRRRSIGKLLIRVPSNAPVPLLAMLAAIALTVGDTCAYFMGSSSAKRFCNGRMCSAPNFIMVNRSVHAEFLEMWADLCPKYELTIYDDAERQLTANRYRLQASYFGNDPQELEHFKGLNYARLCININPADQDPTAPWGNYGLSGHSPVENFIEKLTRRQLVEVGT